MNERRVSNIYKKVSIPDCIKIKEIESNAVIIML